MSRVLLTGASGFVGRHCIHPLLEAGFEVHATARKAHLGSGVEWHQVDLLDDGAVDDLVAAVDPSHLLHCAWYLEPGKYASSAINLEWAESSLHLLRRFTERGGGRALLVGSCFEYAWDEPLLSESTPLRARTVYGRSKAALSELAAALGEAMSASVAWGRLFFLYGAHEDRRRLLASVISNLLAGEAALCTLGTQERDYMYVEDAGRALVAILGSEVVGPVNVATGIAPSVASLVTRAAELVGRPDLLRLGSLPTAPDDPPRLVADVGRLHNEVGWNALTSVDQALRETIAYWRQL